MSTLTRDTSETSVTFSLAELARIEEERVREEDVRRAQARDREARQRREAEAQRRATEAAEVAAAEAARAKRIHEEAAAKVRLEARERAATDVARIEAEARARLEADNALRAHELAVLRARAEGGQRRLVRILGAALVLGVCGGGAAVFSETRRAAALEQDVEQLRDGQRALGRERDSAKETALKALDRRHAALLARASGGAASEEARATAETARHAVDPRALDHDSLRAFADALDALDARLATLDRISALDRRSADLAVWAASSRRTEITTTARTAAVRAKATGTDDAVRAYEVALDWTRDALAQSSSGPRATATTGVAATTGAAAGTCVPGDPRCDLNGHPIF